MEEERKKYIYTMYIYILLFILFLLLLGIHTAICKCYFINARNALFWIWEFFGVQKTFLFCCDFVMICQCYLLAYNITQVAG